MKKKAKVQKKANGAEKDKGLKKTGKLKKGHSDAIIKNAQKSIKKEEAKIEKKKREMEKVKLKIEKKEKKIDKEKARIASAQSASHIQKATPKASKNKPAQPSPDGNTSSVDETVRKALLTLRQIKTSQQLETYINGDTRSTLLKAAERKKISLAKAGR